MHGLINRGLQCFVRDTYGASVWANICKSAQLGFDVFEPMLAYDDDLTEQILSMCAQANGKSRSDLLEDMGTYLIAQNELLPIRRLLRFGGDNFETFLVSLEDLHDRCKILLPELEAPQFEVIDHGGGRYALKYTWSCAGFGSVLLGALRAMADDYGVLAVLTHQAAAGKAPTTGVVTVELLDSSFAKGRTFALAGGQSH